MKEEYKYFAYYFKDDSNKEIIDRVVALNLDTALWYFAERKQMKEWVFLNLFKIVEEDGIQKS